MSESVLRFLMGKSWWVLGQILECLTPPSALFPAEIAGQSDITFPPAELQLCVDLLSNGNQHVLFNWYFVFLVSGHAVGNHPY